MLPSPHHFDKSAHVQGTIVKSDPDIHAIDQDSRGRDSGGSRHRQAKEKASPKRELMALSGSAASPLEDMTAMSSCVKANCLSSASRMATANRIP